MLSACCDRHDREQREERKWNGVCNRNECGLRGQSVRWREGAGKKGQREESERKSGNGVEDKSY